MDGCFQKFVKYMNTAWCLHFSVFLTHIRIQQMWTWLLLWKAKSLYNVGFVSVLFFLPLQKFKTIKIKREKNPYTQTNKCILHISRNFKDMRKCSHRYRSLLFDMFLFQQIEIACQKCNYQVTLSIFLSIQALAIC